MSYARSPLEVCSTTIGTRTECPMLPPDYLDLPALGPFCGSHTPGLALLGSGQSLLLQLQCLGQIGNGIPPQVIHDTRTQGHPAIVHGARHVVVALGKAAGALLVRR